MINFFDIDQVVVTLGHFKYEAIFEKSMKIHLWVCEILRFPLFSVQIQKIIRRFCNIYLATLSCRTDLIFTGDTLMMICSAKKNTRALQNKFGIFFYDFIDVTPSDTLMLHNSIVVFYRGSGVKTQIFLSKNVLRSSIFFFLHSKSLYVTPLSI